MSIHRMRRLLWLGGGLAWSAACGVVVCAVVAPPPEVVPPRMPPMPARKAQAAPPPLPSAEESAAVWRRPLRKPLFDPPPTAPVPTSAPSAPLIAKLLGTIEEEGRSRGLFALKGGATEVRGVGERLGDLPDGAEVVSIEPQRAVLKHHGKSIVLPLEAAP